MPPTTGRWGRIIAVTRLATGLILLFYVLTHNLNHALGLISLSAMEAGHVVFLGFWRPLELVLLLAAVLHLSIGLRALYRRKSLRMPFLEATQLALGLAAPPLLLLHIRRHLGGACALRRRRPLCLRAVGDLGLGRTQPRRDAVPRRCW